jgi:hypothetical protein
VSLFLEGKQADFGFPDFIYNSVINFTAISTIFARIRLHWIIECIICGRKFLVHQHGTPGPGLTSLDVEILLLFQFLGFAGRHSCDFIAVYNLLNEVFKFSRL